MSRSSSVKLGAPSAGDALIALLLLLCAAVAYALTFSPALIGDGPMIVFQLDWAGEGLMSTMHQGYLLSALMIVRSCGVDSAQALEAMSIAGPAVAIAAGFLMLRSLGIGRWAAIATCALLACAPMTRLWASHIELHAWHLGWVALTAYVAVVWPWRRLWTGCLLIGLLFGWTWGCHRSTLVLAPAFGALAAAGLARRLAAQVPADRQPQERRAPLLVALCVALACAAGIPLFQLLVRLVWRIEVPFQAGSTLAYIQRWSGGSWLKYLYTDLWGALLLLLPLALLGGLGKSALAWERLAALLTLILSVGFFARIGLPMRGGYTLAVAPFLLIPAGRGIELLAASRAGTALALAALVLQFALASAWLGDSDEQELAQRRRERERWAETELPRQALWLASDPLQQIVDPGDVREAQVHAWIDAAIDNGLGPEAFAAEFLRLMPVGTGSRSQMPLVLTLEGTPGSSAAAVFAPYLASLAAALGAEPWSPPSRPSWLLAAFRRDPAAPQPQPGAH